jgi:hypothetical protein
MNRCQKGQQPRGEAIQEPHHDLEFLTSRLKLGIQAQTPTMHGFRRHLTDAFDGIRTRLVASEAYAGGATT